MKIISILLFATAITSTLASPINTLDNAYFKPNYENSVDNKINESSKGKGEPLVDEATLVSDDFDRGRSMERKFNHRRANSLSRNRNERRDPTVANNAKKFGSKLSNNKKTLVIGSTVVAGTAGAGYYIGKTQRKPATPDVLDAPKLSLEHKRDSSFSEHKKTYKREEKSTNAKFYNEDFKPGLSENSDLNGDIPIISLFSQENLDDVNLASRDESPRTFKRDLDYLRELHKRGIACSAEEVERLKRDVDAILEFTENDSNLEKRSIFSVVGSVANVAKSSAKSVSSLIAAHPKYSFAIGSILTGVGAYGISKSVQERDFIDEYPITELPGSVVDNDDPLISSYALRAPKKEAELSVNIQSRDPVASPTKGIFTALGLVGVAGGLGAAGYFINKQKQKSNSSGFSDSADATSAAEHVESDSKQYGFPIFPGEPGYSAPTPAVEAETAAETAAKTVEKSSTAVEDDTEPIALGFTRDSIFTTSEDKQIISNLFSY